MLFENFHWLMIWSTSENSAPNYSITQYIFQRYLDIISLLKLGYHSPPLRFATNFITKRYNLYVWGKKTTDKAWYINSLNLINFFFKNSSGIYGLVLALSISVQFQRIDTMQIRKSLALIRSIGYILRRNIKEIFYVVRCHRVRKWCTVK